MAQEQSHEVRKLRYQLTQANRAMGKQGQTIHLLRAEVAEVRELNSKIARGHLRILERQVVEMAAEIATLTEKLVAAQNSAEPSSDDVLVEFD